jgi:hypothetical protein
MSTRNASIGGALNTQALTRLHFTTLSPAEQAQAIRRMDLSGHSVHTIANATGLAIEAIAQVLGEHCESAT